MDALAAGHDAAVQMIDTSVVRVHRHGPRIADNNHQDMGRSRGGLTSKIHAVVDSNGLPVHLALTPGEAHDNRLCSALLSGLLPHTMLLADRGYDAGGFTKTIEIPPIASIPFDSRMFGTAANNGQMIAEIASSHRTTKTFLQIAQRLTGRGEAKNPRGSFLSPIIRKLRVNKA
jgi:Transposase DDE domain